MTGHSAEIRHGPEGRNRAAGSGDLAGPPRIQARMEHLNGLRVQGDPWQELCALSEGFCPGCLIPLRFALRHCPRCHRWWEIFRTPDGVPGYAYHGGAASEWYYVYDGDDDDTI